MTVSCHSINVTVAALGLYDKRPPALADLG